MTRHDLPTAVPNFHSLNLARYAAALYLALFHLLPVSSMVDGPWKNLFSKGYFGTDFFFLLSGFLLTHIYATKVRTDAETLTFYVKRLSRLYPPYLLGLLISLPVAMFSKHPLSPLELVRQASAYLLGLQTWTWNWNFILNIPAWSVSALLFFYAMFPFSLRILKQLRERLPVIMLGIWMVYLMVPSLYLMIAPDAASASVFNDQPWMNFLKFNPLVRLPDFLLGMCAALLVQTGQIPQWLGHRLALPLLLVGLIGIATTIPAATTLYPLLHNGLLTPLLLSLVLALSFDQSWFARLGARPLSRKLADSSLQIFLLHLPFSAYIHKAAELFGWLKGEITAPLAVAIVLLLIPLGYWIDQYLMRPISTALLRAWNARQPCPAIQSSAQPEHTPQSATRH